MMVGDRRGRLDAALAEFRSLWHPQPFREPRPGWCQAVPALAVELLALTDQDAARLADDGDAALGLIARHLPAVAEVVRLADLPEREGGSLPDYGPFWAWEIPGRKRAQIEAFAAAAHPSGRPVVDWCGGKGHLGRLLGLHWQQAVETVEIDAALCAEGRELGRRAAVDHRFRAADALDPATPLASGGHGVALHACGELHRTFIRRGAAAGLAALDVAPCCYHRGVDDHYQPLSDGLHTLLTRDDTRLAVTETVTAAPREARRRDREMAWKLGFDAWRRIALGEDGYRPFKPVPPAWFRGSFADFLARMAERQGSPVPSAADADRCESLGRQRQGEVMRLSILRHAFRRPLEVWLALDLAAFLEGEGYAVALGAFCHRRLTPRNLLLSARR